MEVTTVDPVAMAYHELRSPLSLVITAARSAAEECPEDYDFLRARCQSIVRAAERMLLTAHEVLAVHSKSSPGGERLFDPLESLPSVIEAFSAFGVKLSLTTEDTCGLVRGSADRFETLITCLLNNAIDHAEPGAEIELRARLRQADVVVEVRNPLAAVDRHQGYGMGTRIAVELARGLDAEVFSSSMDGTFCVTIRLPLATEAALAS